MRLEDVTVNALGLTGSFWATQVKETFRMSMLGLVRAATTPVGMVDVFRRISVSAAVPLTVAAGWRVIRVKSSDIVYGGPSPEAYMQGASAPTYAPELPEDISYPPSSYTVDVAVAEAEPEYGVPVWFVRYPSDYIPYTVEVGPRTLSLGVDFRVHGQWLLFFEDPVGLLVDGFLVCSSGSETPGSAMAHVLSLDREVPDVREVAAYRWRSHSMTQFFRAACAAAGYRFVPRDAYVHHVQPLSWGSVYLTDDGAVVGESGISLGGLLSADVPVGNAVVRMGQAHFESYGYFPLGLALGPSFSDVWIATGDLTMTVVANGHVTFKTYAISDGSFVETNSDYSEAAIAMLNEYETNYYTALTGNQVWGVYPEDTTFQFNLFRALVRAGILDRILVFWMKTPSGAAGRVAYNRMRRFVDEHRPNGVACYIIPFTP